MSHRISLQPSGHSFDVSPGEYVLSAGLAAGLNLPYSCRVGMCRSCRARLVSGEVELSDYLPHVLTPEMQAKNLVLLCRAKARSDLVIEVQELTLSAQKPKIIPCRVKRIDRPAPDIAILSLRLPQNENMRFAAGQYVDVLLPGGKRRAYSIANAPRAEGVIDLDIHVRHSPGGMFTDQVFATMKERDLLRFEAPLGTFYLREDSDKPVLFLASGTGFAPIKSMIEYMAARKIARPVLLYWGGRTRRDLYMHDLAASWAESIPNFRFVPVLSDPLPADNWTGRTGLVHRAVFDDVPDLSGFQVYASGNPLMVDAARADFIKSRGLPESEFFADAFVTEAERARLTGAPDTAL
jgi:CDP-4-dehydro-6-deoxyglucose reductase